MMAGYTDGGARCEIPNRGVIASPGWRRRHQRAGPGGRGGVRSATGKGVTSLLGPPPGGGPRDLRPRGRGTMGDARMTVVRAPHCKTVSFVSYDDTPSNIEGLGISGIRRIEEPYHSIIL